jgi:hypothetical protein
MNLLFSVLRYVISLGICVGVLFYNSSLAAVEQTISSDNVPLEPMLQLQNGEDWDKISIPEDQLPSIMSDEVLAQLQELLLKDVLSKQQMPGTAQPVWFPDLPFIFRESAVMLINENLAHSISIEELSVPVRILSQETLLEEARTHGDIAYLRFQPLKVEDDIVQLTLEAKICPRNLGQLTLGLSGVRVMFQKVSDKWQVVGEPIIFSS